jgi:hypothetical protein
LPALRDPLLQKNRSSGVRCQGARGRKDYIPSTVLDFDPPPE